MLSIFHITRAKAGSSSHLVLFRFSATKKMADKVETVEKALSLTSDLRSAVTKVFRDIVSQPTSGNSGETPAAVQSLKQNLGSVQSSLRSVDRLFIQARLNFKTIIWSNC